MENKVYSNLEEMFDAIRDENGVLHPKAITVEPDSPVIHLWCGRYFNHYREFLEDERCNSGRCKLQSADK
jgi:hypothetical protein